MLGTGKASLEVSLESISPLGTHSKAHSMLPCEPGHRNHPSTLSGCPMSRPAAPMARGMGSQPHPCSPSALHHQQHRHTPTEASTSAKYSLPPAAAIHSGLWNTEWDQTPFQVSSCPGFSWRKITPIPAKSRTSVNSDYYFTLQLIFLFHNLCQQIAEMPFHPEKHL